MKEGALPVGDRATLTSPTQRRQVLVEVAVLWLVTLLAIRGVVWLQGAAGLPDWTLAAVPFLFIYAPVGLCHLRGADSWAYRLWIPALRDFTTWGRAFVVAGIVLALVAVPWIPLYHFWQTSWFPEILQQLGLRGMAAHPRWDRLPAEPLTLVAYQVFFVAIPEEFFYRGYLQTRLNEAFDRRFLVAGVPFGHGLWIACLLFAFGHSLVVVRWWHFATFFPGLLFGLLRERTGNVTAGALLHAAFNILVVTLDTMYGIVPP